MNIRSLGTHFHGRNSLLLFDQVVCSASNAGGVLIAAFLLDSNSLNVYVTMQLIGTSLIGFQRAFFLDPSLVVHDSQAIPVAYGRWLSRALIPIGLLALAILYVAGTGWNPTLLVASLFFPLVQDCFRYRSLAHQRYSRTLASDSLWLVCLVSGSLLIAPSNSPTMLGVWGLSAALALPPLLFGSKDTAPGRVGPALNLGKFQVAEWGIATCTSVAPLLIVQATLPAGSVAAFRLAQTAMGPLNTINSFVMVKFLLSSKRLQSLQQQLLVSTVRRASLVLSTFTLAYGALICTGLYLFRPFLDPELVKQIIYAAPVTVIAAIVMSPCTPYLALARSLSLQRLTILPRVIVLMVNVAGTAFGFWLWQTASVDPLVPAILFTAVASLISYKVMFTNTIATHITAKQSSFS